LPAYFAFEVSEGSIFWHMGLLESKDEIGTLPATFRAQTITFNDARNQGDIEAKIGY
jgi:hypothetical protein